MLFRPLKLDIIKSEAMKSVPTYLLTHSLTYLLTYSLTYLLTHLLTYTLTHSLTHSMAQSPSWEANRFAASQEIPRISRNPKVHYRTHNSPSTVPILSQLDPFQTPTSHFLKIHRNIILPSKPRSPQWSLSFWFPHQTQYTPLLSPRSATCPTHLTLRDLTTRTLLGEQYRSLSSTLWSVLPIQYVTESAAYLLMP